MKNMKWMIGAALLMGTFAHADIMTLTIPKSPTVINGIQVSESAKVAANNNTYDLSTVGAGLRSKTVVIVPVKVYVAQLMVSTADKANFNKGSNSALPSLDKVTSVAIRLNFLRDVDAQTVATSFQDGLDANKVPAKDADIVEFMKRVNQNGDVKNGGALNIFITKNADGTETLVYENIKGGASTPSVMQGQKGLTHKILSIWLGTPADSGLDDLKSQLLK